MGRMPETDKVKMVLGKGIHRDDVYLYTTIRARGAVLVCLYAIHWLSSPIDRIVICRWEKSFLCRLMAPRWAGSQYGVFYDDYSLRTRRDAPQRPPVMKDSSVRYIVNVSIIRIQFHRCSSSRGILSGLNRDWCRKPHQHRVPESRRTSRSARGCAHEY